MKKLIILFLFIIGLLLQVAAKEKELTVIKIGKNVTILNYEDCGNSKYWSDKVKIIRTDTILPSDAEMKNMGIPDEEWFAFSENVNGIYDSRVEKLQKKYEKLLEEKNDADYKIEKLEDEAQAVYVDDDSALNYQLAKEVKEKGELQTDYNKLFAEKSRVDDLVNILAFITSLLITIIILIGLKTAQKKFQKKFKSATM